MKQPHSAASIRAVRQWLMTVITLIVLMVSVGGITRLTGSGLSITEWKPIMGVIPPLDEAEWQVAFAKYQRIPQFERLNSDMTLAGFKWIFFWEYLHRLLGRLIGLAYGLPLVWFLLRKRIPWGFRGHAIAGFFLGGLQGFMGWFMVKSGLSELTYVSHFRLSAHLLLAFFIAAYLLWIHQKLGERCEGSPERVTPDGQKIARFVPWIAGAVLCQTFYGALTAGLKAGYMYPTFPTFLGHWIHPDLVRPEMGWMNLLSNPTTVQAVHRVLGTGVVLSLLALWLRFRRRPLLARERRALAACSHLSATQYGAGILLVCLGVPVWIGALHQFLGCILFLLTARLWMVFSDRGRAS